MNNKPITERLKGKVLKLPTSKNTPAHSILSPSSAKTWIACNKYAVPITTYEGNDSYNLGSALNSKVKRLNFFRDVSQTKKSFREHYIPSPNVSRGSILHDLAEKSLNGELTQEMIDNATEEIASNEREIKDFYKVLNIQLPYNLEYGETLDVKKVVMTYYNYIKSLNCLYHTVEIKAHIKIGKSETFGTADYMGIDNNATLHIVDFKTGARKVKAYENKQLALYALSVNKKKVKFKDVMFHIVQPTTNDIDIYKAPKSFLRKVKNDFKSTYKNLLRYATNNRPESIDLEINVNEGCIFCSHLATCSTFQNEAYNLLEDIGRTDYTNKFRLHAVRKFFGLVSKVTWNISKHNDIGLTIPNSFTAIERLAKTLIDSPTFKEFTKLLEVEEEIKLTIDPKTYRVQREKIVEVKNVFKRF